MPGPIGLLGEGKDAGIGQERSRQKVKMPRAIGQSRTLALHMTDCSLSDTLYDPPHPASNDL